MKGINELSGDLWNVADERGCSFLTQRVGPRRLKAISSEAGSTRFQDHYMAWFLDLFLGHVFPFACLLNWCLSHVFAHFLLCYRYRFTDGRARLLPSYQTANCSNVNTQTIRITFTATTRRSLSTSTKWEHKSFLLGYVWLSGWLTIINSRRLIVTWPPRCYGYR